MSLSKEGEFAREASLSEEGREVEKVSVKSGDSNEENFKEGSKLVGAEMEEASDIVSNVNEAVVPDEIFGQRMSYDSFDSENCLFAEGWGHRVSEADKLRRRDVQVRVEVSDGKVSESGSSLDEVCGLYKKKSKRETVLAICE